MFYYDRLLGEARVLLTM